MDWKTLFLDANGRIGKKDFWIGFLILFVAGIILSFLPIIGQIAGLLLIYPNVCVFSKRLHDFGKTGWLAAVPFVIGLLAGVVGVAVGGATFLSAGMGGTMSDTDALAAVGSAGLVFLLAFVAYVGFVLWIGLSKGDEGTNRYGSPRNPPLTGA